MKTLSRILILPFLLFTTSCSQEQKQLDQAGIEGVWEVAEVLYTDTFTVVLELLEDGSYCEREYGVVREGDLHCVSMGSWKVEDERLIFKLSDISNPDPLFDDIKIFDVVKEDESYLLTRLNDRNGVRQNLPVQKLRMTRR